jgi:hypothetical protein
MKRFAVSVLLVAMLAASAAPAAGAVNVERQGSENAFIEVARTACYGALAGVLVGSAIALAQDNGKGGDDVRWGFVIGTFGGLGYGIVHVNSRPKASALLELGGARPASGGLAAIEAVPSGARVRAIALRF